MVFLWRSWKIVILNLGKKIFLRLLVKHNTLQLSFLPLSRLFQDSRIVNRFSWFWKSLNTADWGVSSAFSKVFIHTRTDVRVNISISAKPMPTKFGKQVHLEALNQMRLMKQLLVTPLRQDHVALKKCYNFLSLRTVKLITKKQQLS